MSKTKNTNPFCGIDESLLPIGTQQDYHKDSDEYIIDYFEVEHVKLNSDDDTDFIKTITIEESSRTKRQEYINSFACDVGIKNILQKMALSGDESLKNQIKRLSIPGTEKDALGRPVEDIADYSQYCGLDRVDALNGYKKGASEYQDLPEELKGKKSLEGVAKMTDAEIDAYIKAKVDAAVSQINAAKDTAGGKL